jgi:hypothetical protein
MRDGTISPPDLNLFTVTDDPAEVESVLRDRLAGVAASTRPHRSRLLGER